MNKIVVNSCYGGFGLSDEALELGQIISGNPDWGYWYRDIPRHDPILVRVVEELGKAANGLCADLRIATIPGNKYRIDEYDGIETVRTPESLTWIEI